MTAAATSSRTAADSAGSRRAWHLRANAAVLVYLAAAVVAVVAHDALPMPRWLAIHLLLLGAVSNAIVTWTEHFAVALMRARPPSRRMSASRLIGLNAAVVGVLVGVAGDLTWLTLVAAALLTVVVVAHVTSLVVVWRRALMGRFARTVGYYVAAGITLVVGIGLGVSTSMAQQGAWGLSAVHEQLHVAHVHANVFGWIGLTVLGTLFTLWPTVLRTRMVDGVMADASRSLWLTTVGLATAVIALVADLRAVAALGLLVYGVGVVLALRPFVLTWRRKAPTDAAAWSMAAGIAWLALAVVADVALLATAGGADAYVEQLNSIVPAVAVGFALQVLLGALTYLVPVVRGGGPAPVRDTIAQLSPLWAYRVVALNLGVAVVLLAALVDVPNAVAAVGWALVLAPVAAFLGLVVRVVLPAQARGLAGGIALGVVMTLVPVLIAVSGQGAGTGPSSVRVGTSSSGVQEVQVTLVGMDIRPAVVQVPAGARVRLVVTNRESMRHDLAFANGPSTPMLSRGQSAQLDLGVVQGNLSGWCTVAGHRAAGMTLDVRIEPAKTSTGDLSGHSTPTPAATQGLMPMPTPMSTPTAQLDVQGQPGASARDVIEVTR